MCRSCILFEFCPQSLYDLLRTAEKPLELGEVLRLARQVALGLYYLHCCKPPVVHLDLKSANVLLDKHGHAKVCDFGLAHLKLGADVRTERMGSPMWTAPEVCAVSRSMTTLLSPCGSMISWNKE